MEYEEASKVNEGEEISIFDFPASNGPSEILHPGKEPLYFPAAFVSPERTSILVLLFAVGAVGRDHLDDILMHLFVQCVNDKWRRLRDRREKSAHGAPAKDDQIARALDLEEVNVWIVGDIIGQSENRFPFSPQYPVSSRS